MAVRGIGGWCEMAASLEAEERPLLEIVTKQSSEECDGEHQSLCYGDLQSVLTRV
jgi:hypothetical protein